MQNEDSNRESFVNKALHEVNVMMHKKIDEFKLFNDEKSHSELLPVFDFLNYLALILIWYKAPEHVRDKHITAISQDLKTTKEQMKTVLPKFFELMNDPEFLAIESEFLKQAEFKFVLIPDKQQEKTSFVKLTKEQGVQSTIEK